MIRVLEVDDNSEIETTTDAYIFSSDIRSEQV